MSLFWNLSQYRKQKKRAYLAQMALFQQHNHIKIMCLSHEKNAVKKEKAKGFQGKAWNPPNNLQAHMKQTFTPNISFFLTYKFVFCSICIIEKGCYFIAGFHQSLTQQNESVKIPHQRPRRKLLLCVLPVPTLSAHLEFPTRTLLSL